MSPTVRPPVLASLDRDRIYHFIGIGGHGMSGLAHVLLGGGFRVTGSDAQASDRLQRLRDLGARVAVGHDQAHVEGAHVVVYSTDVPQDNVELAAARRAGLEVWHRSDMLAALVNPNPSVAITGTHGKTTITAMVGSILLEAGVDPTVLVGGHVDVLGGHARLGAGPWVVAEACESDGSFLRYRPLIGVVTSIEPEHLDHYGGSFDRMVDAFQAFASQVRPGGALILAADDGRVRDLAGAVDPEVEIITYGQDPGARFTFTGPRPWENGVRFTVLEEGQELFEASLGVPGLYNVSNALAAIAVARRLDLPLERVAASLAAFKGAQRRFQVVSDRGGVLVVDDYAHHPTEIRATLLAARERTPGRLICVFQPQRYSRTRALMDDFSRSFGGADEIILTEIYSPPGDPPLPGVSASALAGRIQQREGRPVRVIPRQSDIVGHLEALVQPGDVVLTMGAGDIWKVAHDLAHRLARTHPA